MNPKCAFQNKLAEVRLPKISPPQNRELRQVIHPKPALIRIGLVLAMLRMELPSQSKLTACVFISDFSSFAIKSFIFS